MREGALTFANRQALSVPSAADLANTNATSDVTPQAHDPVAGLNFRIIIENFEAADDLTTGNFIVELLRSTDGVPTFRTDGGVVLADIPAAQLASGQVVNRNTRVAADFFYSEGIVPGNMEFRVRFRTNGHTTALQVDIRATVYIDDGGAGSFN